MVLDCFFNKFSILYYVCRRLRLPAAEGCGVASPADLPAPQPARLIFPTAGRRAPALQLPMPAQPPVSWD